MNLSETYINVRIQTENICKNLSIEDYSVQPIVYVSPPKWHLAHTTWFFETFVLQAFNSNYKTFKSEFSSYFNSYYNNVGIKTLRSHRGLLTRPLVDEVYQYRAYVDTHICELLKTELTQEIKSIIEIGIHHEQQHQELLYYDIKYILGHQPSFPSINNGIALGSVASKSSFISIKEGLYDIGHKSHTFCYDNELGVHKVWLSSFEISTELVSNEEYLAFINDGGYQNFNLWHAEGWDFIQQENIKAPEYWHNIDGNWNQYTLEGLKPLDLKLPVQHISIYEASAYAEWRKMRLPTEFEWEVASKHFKWGQLWEWTNSAYLPYPNYTKASGALGEYNGKFMINQMVLRGASKATSLNHSRYTYRNFFHPHLRWMYSGIRLIK